MNAQSMTEKRKVLVVDDDRRILELLRDFLERMGMEVATASSGPKALARLERGDLDVLLTDLVLPGADGLELLEHLGGMSMPPVAIVLTGHGSIESAVKAMRLGAFDYITKPIHLEEIRIVLEKALSFRQLRRENLQLRQQLREKYRFENLIGHSQAMQSIQKMVERVADTDSTVLIFGESGTGKELVARALHYNSHRREGPLVVVNCSAIPQDLLESELFGHEQGAFTGAVKTRIGKFESAQGGTVFLDEIGDMSPHLQAKLLRVLQEHEIERLGGGSPLRVDVRIIAATHRNLEEAIKEGRFREDLYYRLNVIPIRVPPLRERKSDIPLLIQHFVEKFNSARGKRLTGFSKEAVELLMSYSWPGNVRELEHLVERMVILQGQGVVEASELPPPYSEAARKQAQPSPLLPEEGMDLPGWMREVERGLILQALARSGGVKNKAARLLGIHRTTLVEKMRRLGLLGGPKGSHEASGRVPPIS